MPSPHSMRQVTPRILRMVVLYVDGYTSAAVANELGVSVETVRSAIVVTRNQLRREGYRNLSTIIGLRKALRARGDLNHLEKI